MSALSKLGLFSLGMTAGVVVAMLVAPKSGEDSRAYISDAVRRAMDRAKGKGKPRSRGAQETASQVAEKAREYIGNRENFGESENSPS